MYGYDCTKPNPTPTLAQPGGLISYPKTTEGSLPPLKYVTASIVVKMYFLRSEKKSHSKIWLNF